jgi:predicted transposase YbfD/YdcC
MAERECTTLHEVLKRLPDPRERRGRRYTWELLLTLIGAALVSGQQTAAAMAQWIAEHAGEWQAWWPTGAAARVPSAATIRRTLRRLEPEGLEAGLAAFMAQVVPPPSPQAAVRPLAVDGKAVRGAQAHGARIHLVSLVTHRTALVLGQVAVAEKSNEIPAARALLTGRDLQGCLITLDALHTQRATARLILAQGGQYLMVVKANQPDLYAALTEWFAEPAWAEEQEQEQEQEQTVTTHGKGHGRLERRTLTRRVATHTLLDWPGVAQVLQRRCWAQDRTTGREREEVSYGLTSVPGSLADAAQLEGYWRGHWSIENQVHYVRDVTCHEDAGQAHVGHAPQVLAALRNGLLTLLRCYGWTNMAAAMRHIAASLDRAFRLLVDPVPRLHTRL